SETRRKKRRNASSATRCTPHRTSAGGPLKFPRAFPARIATAPLPAGLGRTRPATGRTKNPWPRECQLRAAMERLIWRAKGERYDHKDVWPEYSELSCFACHHALGPAKDSWRQEHGYAGRRPGDPAWNGSRYAVFRLLARQIDSADAQELDRQIAFVSQEMSKLNPDRNAVAAAAVAAVPIAQRFAARLATLQYDQALTLRMLQSIADNAEEISLADERAAEQAAMAVDSLYIAYSKEAKPPNAAEARAAINVLFQLLENPSSYNADQFAAALGRL